MYSLCYYLIFFLKKMLGRRDTQPHDILVDIYNLKKMFFRLFKLVSGKRKVMEDECIFHYMHEDLCFYEEIRQDSDETDSKEEQTYDDWYQFKFENGTVTSDAPDIEYMYNRKEREEMDQYVPEEFLCNCQKYECYFCNTIVA